ncbi:MAG TPA: MmgE/PrpD family protein [Alphaproteobacteria bacterium]|nr:MmgE/PrpD family protein [Alphaproteobacteria bacterium]
MSAAFIERVCDLIERPRPLEPAERREALIAFEDTMAVAYAGWHEPVVEAVAPLYRGTAAKLIDGSGAASIEHAVFIHATAGHALDYDDVELTGVTHPSVCLVPGLLALSEARPVLAERTLSAYAVGLAVNIALSRIFGFSHYDKGWHATCTIGPPAGGAALAHLLGLDRARTRHALALAAAQAGGLQRNFGAMAKPVQAGFAAAAAVRSALLAEAGITGDADIFGPRGYFDLYAGSERGEDPADIAVEIRMMSLARKLYPCCYLTHRLIAAALEARDRLGAAGLPDDARLRVTTPFGGMRPLIVFDPKTGLEGKFCGAYTIAAALAQGSVGLADFEDEAVVRPAVRALMRRIDLSEEPLAGEMPIGLDHGTVRLAVEAGGRDILSTEISAHPGSPGRPATNAEMTAKIADCLALYRDRDERGPSLDAFRNHLRRALGMETIDA